MSDDNGEYGQPGQRWIYVNDMHQGHAKIFHPEAGVVRQISVGNVRDKAPCGLRFGILEAEGDAMYRELGLFAEPTEALFSEVEDAYRHRNSWMYDYPHYQLTMEDHTAERAQIAEKVMAMMAKHPWKFEIIGLQRRYLFYFSDGDHKSQKYFVGLCPAPGANSPYRRDGSLRRRYMPAWSSQMRDNKVPYPSEWEEDVGDLRPLLYQGPAYVMRFLLDDQQPAHGHCLMYLTPEGDFIGSDWCQRHDFTSYGGGINLQIGIQTADAWITNSCMVNAIDHRVFTPKSATFVKADVRELMKKQPLITIPSDEEAMAIAEKKLAQKALADGDPLDLKIKTLVAEKPDASTGALVEELLTLLEADRAAGDTTRLNGLPFFIKKLMVPETAHKAMEPFLVTELVYGFTSQKGTTCDKGPHAGQICFEWRKGKPEHQHHHFHPSSLTLDMRRIERQLVDRILELRTPKPEPVEGIGPITAEIMQEALLAAEKLDLARTLQLHRDLIGDGIRRANGLTPIEAAISGGSAEKPLEFGTARFTPVDGTNDVVIHEWLTGKYAFPDKVFRYTMLEKVEGQRSYIRQSIFQPSLAAIDVVEKSAVWYALEWYFVGRHAAPAAATTSAAPSTPSATGAIAAPSTERKPYVFKYGKIDYVAKIVNETEEIVEISSPATGDEATVQRGKNGHPYMLVDGMRLTMEASDFRDAVLHFYTDEWANALGVVSTGATA